VLLYNFCLLYIFSATKHNGEIKLYNTTVMRTVIVISCCSTVSDWPHRCCQIANSFDSRRIFSILLSGPRNAPLRPKLPLLCPTENRKFCKIWVLPSVTLSRKLDSEKFDTASRSCCQWNSSTVELACLPHFTTVDVSWLLDARILLHVCRP